MKSTAPPRPDGMLKNITWLTLGSVAVKPLWFLFIGVLCWRWLRTEAYGVMTTTLSLAFIAASFSDLGLSRYSIREVARHPGEASAYFSNVLVLRVAMACVAWGATMAAGLWIGYGRAELLALAWAGVYTITLNLTTYCRSFFQAFEVLRYEAVSLIVEKALVITLGLALLVSTYTPEGTLAGMALGMGLTLLLNIGWIARRMAPLRRSVLSRSFMKTAFRGALPLGMYMLFIVLYNRTGPVLLEAWHGALQTGQFGAAYRLVEALLLLPMVVTAAVFPRLSSLFSATEGPAQFRQVLRRSIGATLAVAVPVAALVSALAPMLMTLINPEAAALDAGLALRWLVWAFPLICINQLYIVAYVAQHRQRFLVGMLGGIALLNLLLHFLLTLPYGLFGLCAVTLLTEAAITAIFLWPRSPKTPA